MAAFYYCSLGLYPYIVGPFPQNKDMLFWIVWLGNAPSTLGRGLTSFSLFRKKRSWILPLVLVSQVILFAALLVPVISHNQSPHLSLKNEFGWSLIACTDILIFLYLWFSLKPSPPCLFSFDSAFSHTLNDFKVNGLYSILFGYGDTMTYFLAQESASRRMNIDPTQATFLVSLGQQCGALVGSLTSYLVASYVLS